MTNLGWLVHKITHRRHKWRYFIDGGICRSCETCPVVQYDLPTIDRLPNGAPTNRRRSWR